MMDNCRNTEGLQAKVTWQDVSEPAALLFDVWVGQPELRWAEKAWNALENHGLTAYGNEIERQVVLIRLLALSMMYQEFCYMARDMGFMDYDGISDRAQEIGISPFRVAQLIGPQFGEDKRDDNSLFHGALFRLTNRERPGIYLALLDAFDGYEMLFAALWRSQKAERTTDDEAYSGDDYEEDVDVTLHSNIVGSKLRTWMWFMEGMPCVA